MRRTGEVLKLQAEGRSLGEIAISLNMGKTTVRACLERGRTAGLSCPCRANWTMPPWRPSSSRVEPRSPRRPNWTGCRYGECCPAVATRSPPLPALAGAQPGLSAQPRLHSGLRQVPGEQVAQDLVMRFEYTDGERAFIDFCGDTTDLI